MRTKDLQVGGAYEVASHPYEGPVRLLSVTGYVTHPGAVINPSSGRLGTKDYYRCMVGLLVLISLTKGAEAADPNAPEWDDLDAEAAIARQAELASRNLSLRVVAPIDLHPRGYLEQRRELHEAEAQRRTERYAEQDRILARKTELSRRVVEVIGGDDMAVRHEFWRHGVSVLERLVAALDAGYVAQEQVRAVSRWADRMEAEAPKPAPGGHLADEVRRVLGSTP